MLLGYLISNEEAGSLLNECEQAGESTKVYWRGSHAKSP
jgi:hypothetical protein